MTEAEFDGAMILAKTMVSPEGSQLVMRVDFVLQVARAYVALHEDREGAYDELVQRGKIVDGLMADVQRVTKERDEYRYEAEQAACQAHDLQQDVWSLEAVVDDLGGIP